MADFITQLDDKVIVDGSGATDAEGEQCLLDAHCNGIAVKTRPAWLLTPRQPIVSAMAMAAGRHRDIRNERKIVNVIDLYVSTYGELDVVLDRNMAGAPCCWLTQLCRYTCTASDC